ncbi:SRPBCC family protein [Streptomyces sp. Babs14]|uniref:SRPBCC family protein n=1 Tax=unclassified Streptomyces TaxID=2593676 RepID=UPI001C234690|nr:MULTISPECIES: SRPBCC family protein [unclassified Streptomyces]MBU8550925.1 SRPBCC family protein [Streptomyces sp. Osf17]MBU8557706.1 SRPBCC family protein [Streptomyces sp. Babs14]
MEHEVFVPVPAERLGDVLADPVRVARAVPGLQQDAGAEPVAGRLKVRVGSHSITYRGALRLTARDDGTYAVEGEATESRGTGTVALALTLRVVDADGGCTLVISGTATADGRVSELPADAVTASATRLLTRFAENLGVAAEQGAEPGAGAGSGAGAGAGSEAGQGPEAETEPGSETETEPGSETETEPGSETEPGAESEPESETGPARELGAEHVSVFDTEVPPSSLADEEEGTEDEPRAPGEPDVPVVPDLPEPPAEAAHARRTMIGRSAEEVDHAPPRGRYAPVPAPQAGAAGAPLRWAAPAAALVVASAIVVGRALRRRR